MLTKSKIQLIKEGIEIRNNYKDGLSNLMEKYTIEDSIFVYRNGLFEVTSGYFEEINQFDTLNEAISSCEDISKVGIRILNNDKFVTGYVKQFLSECSQDAKILDIETLFEVR